MGYINDLFKIIIVEISNSGNKEWASEYIDFSTDIQKMKIKLADGTYIDLSDVNLYKDLETIRDYPSFVTKLLYERANGISSRGQSVLSKVNLERAKSDSELRDILKKVILSPNSENYVLFEKWWKQFIKANNPVLINRAFAACSPKTLTSTVDNGKFWYVLNFIRSECEFEQTGTGKNWIEWNEMVTKWLDEKLEHELSIYSTELEKNIWRNIFYWMLHEFEPTSFEFRKQLVKYGAPGTGKTFTCTRDVKNHFTLWKNRFYPSYPGNLNMHLNIVQFHPSFTYEDFMEGIRPILKDGKIELKLMNGIFKNFCVEAASWEIDVYHQIPELKEKKWNQIKVSDVSGKLNGGKWQFLKSIKDPENKLLDQVMPPYYIIIDEINRAELSRVFGELMYCLEYRGYNGKIKTQYSSMVESENSETAFWYENGVNYFFIPNNVYILGTMNNIDRSVESFDFALRRRFEWVEVEPDYDVLINDNLPEILEPIVSGLQRLNEKISNDPLLGNDYRIGHAYLMNRPSFMQKISLEDCKNYLWYHSIKPLLEEYLRGSGENTRIIEMEKLFKGV